MKIFYTFLLILVVSITSSAQKTILTNQQNGSFLAGITVDSPSFSIEKVYPNPVKDFVTIDIHSNVSEAIQVRLFNILGTEVKKWESFHLQQGDQLMKFDFSFLKSGVYILKISGSKQVCSQVIKKN